VTGARVRLPIDHRHHADVLVVRVFGNLKEARDWLKKEIDLANTKEVKLMALSDPDLEPLWKEMRKV
jgi:hypothetical protein